MLTVKMGGGFGNQLFQYVLARRLAKQNGEELCIDTSHYDRSDRDASKWFWLEALPIQAVIRRTDQANPFYRLQRKLGVGRSGCLYQESEPGYHPEVFALPPGSTLNGYFQSYRYQEPRDGDILSEIDASHLLGDDHKKLLREIRARGAISVHVRRGDYVCDPRFDVPERYNVLRTALACMRTEFPDQPLFVFSDDIAWCQQSGLFRDDTVYRGASPADHPAIDLHLMSQCAHHVIANSSYSWWAAWLGDRAGKRIIAPRQWFGRHTADDMQILPPHWKQI